MMKDLEKLYRLKDKAETPDRYPGANIDKVQLFDGDVRWSMSSREYLTSAINNLDTELEKEKSAPLRTYGKRAGERKFQQNYRPEIGTSPELNDELGTRYLQLIGILRCAIEIGRIDIITEVSMLSQHQYKPREGHIDAVYRIFWYLKCRLSKGEIGRILFDDREPIEDQSQMESKSMKAWADFYPDAEELKPPNMPQPRGRAVTTACYVDSDHVGNLMTRRSHSGIFIYLQNTPNIWFSKRQNTVEFLSFGLEFIALRIAVEIIEAVRYKLRMFGVSIINATSTYCDNKSVVTNSSIPTSVLNNKYNSICHHRVREVQSAGTVEVNWAEGEYNKADLGTKIMLSTTRRYNLINSIHDNSCTLIDRKEEGS
jgi:hypothetical protein